MHRLALLVLMLAPLLLADVCVVVEDSSSDRRRSQVDRPDADGEPDCERDEDCDGGQICHNLACREMCLFDDDCDAAAAAHCQPLSGLCVECTDDSHCQSGATCMDGVCEVTEVEAICAPFASRCLQDGRQATCNADGSAEELVSCSELLDSCGADGLGCACVDGACAAVACVPGQTRCAGLHSLGVCDGLGISEALLLCDDGNFCQDGSCVPGECAPACGARVCGPDPVCGTSCGACAGTCDVTGVCNEALPPTNCVNHEECPPEMFCAIPLFSGTCQLGCRDSSACAVGLLCLNGDCVVAAGESCLVQPCPEGFDCGTDLTCHETCEPSVCLLFPQVCCVNGGTCGKDGLCL